MSQQTASSGIFFQTWIRASLISLAVSRSTYWCTDTQGPRCSQEGQSVVSMASSSRKCLGSVLHREEPMAHCTKVRSDNCSEELILAPNNSHWPLAMTRRSVPSKSFTSVTCAQWKPPLICGEDVVLVIDLQVQIFSHEGQSISQRWAVSTGPNRERWTLSHFHGVMNTTSLL